MKHLLIAMAVLILSACATTQSLPVSASQEHQRPAYQLMAGDLVDLQITQRQDLSGEYTLAPDGSLFLQNIGRIQLSGLDQETAEQRLRSALEKHYSPISLSLRITRFQGSEFVVIIGAVEQPGKYAIQNQLSLVELIGSASGFTRDADLSRIKLIREDKELAPVKINLERLISRGDLNQNVLLQKGDLIVVPRRPLRVGFNSLNELMPLAQLMILALVTFYQVN